MTREQERKIRLEILKGSEKPFNMFAEEEEDSKSDGESIFVKNLKRGLGMIELKDADI